MVIATAYYGVNMETAGVWYGNATITTSTHIRIADGGYIQNYYGSGFSFNSFGVTGGTVTSTSYYEFGNKIYEIGGGRYNALSIQNYLNSGDIKGLLSYVFAGVDTFNGSPQSDALNGFSGNDKIYGNRGNDTLNGGTGADTMLGGDGNDTYHVDNLGDKVYETTTVSSSSDAGGTTDRIFSSVGFNLAANKGVSFVEKLTLTGTKAIDGTGNAQNNTITGNGAANTLRGGSGNDTLNGGAGNDVLIGGSGSDGLSGGSGNDIFHFDSKVGKDKVTDFNSAADTFRFSQAGLRIGDGDTSAEGFAVRNVKGGFSAASEVVVFTPNVAGGIVSTASAAAVIGTAAGNFAAGATRLFVVDNGAESGIFLFKSSALNATVSAAELTQIASFNGTTTAGSDYVFAA